MNNQFEEMEITTHLSPEVIYQQDKAAIDMQIATAKAYPRNIKRATDDAVAIVSMDSETAKSCTYSVPRGGKAITGPSIHLAKILYQVWENLRIESKVVAIDATQITSEAVCFDLQRNIAVKVQVKRSIMSKAGRFNDDMITVTGNAANAIALRNAVLATIPKPVVDKVYNAAKQAITGDVSDKNKLIAKRKLVFDGLRDTFNLSEKEILSAVGKQTIEHITPDDLVVLIGIGTAIRDGDTTAEQAFKGAKDATGASTIAVDELQKLLDEKAALLSKTELESAKRIIENQEKDSYKKLLNLLNAKA